MVLKKYCSGERERPSWGISAADFHEEGRLGLKLGSFPTTFLVKKFSRKAILEALEKGRMYCSNGDTKTWPKLDLFTVSDGTGQKSFMGETLTTNQIPLIRFKISQENGKAITVLLIRSGKVIQTIKEKTPIEVEYLDEAIPEGNKIYYRIMDSSEHLISNPIFVVYNPVPSS